MKSDPVVLSENNATSDRNIDIQTDNQEAVSVRNRIDRLNGIATFDRDASREDASGATSGFSRKPVPKNPSIANQSRHRHPHLFHQPQHRHLNNEGTIVHPINVQHISHPENEVGLRNHPNPTIVVSDENSSRVKISRGETDGTSNEKAKMLKTPNFIKGNIGCRNRRALPNIRDCYSKALKVHIAEIVDQIMFKETNLPDSLIGNGCLTEDECSYIRERRERKDQMRLLLAVIRGRDMKIMEHLVECIGHDNALLARKIKERVDENINSGFRDTSCVRCKLKVQVNVKYVADEMYSKEFISDRLYNEIIHNERPAGAQDELWDRLLQEVNFNKDAFGHLKTSLCIKEHYNHLAEEIDRFMSLRDYTLSECACNVPLRPVSIRSVSTTDSLYPNSSDSPRDSEISVELRSRLIEQRGPRPNAMFIPHDQHIMTLKDDASA